MKDTLYADLATGAIDIRQATQKMRKILGMSQKDYAQKIAGFSPRILSEFENGTSCHLGKNSFTLWPASNVFATRAMAD